METDGTMGPSQVLAGPNFDIGAALGTQAGGNLFHSFTHFNINTGESANFSGPASIDNVISRVTGGSLSNIDGLLSSTIAGADVFLINPSGILFGPNASLDVDGSFHASTADQILFPDAGVFDATNPGATVLSVAEPSAFGFLDANPAQMSVQGSFLAVPDSEIISLVGGDLHIDGGVLLANQGQIHLSSVASAGTVPLDDLSVPLAGFDSLGTIELVNGSLAAVDGAASGTIAIRGGQLIMDQSTLSSTTWGSGSGGGIVLSLSGDMVMSGGAILSDTVGGGDAGALTITAQNITLINGAFFGLNSFGSGRGGDLAIDATGTVFLTGTDGFGFRSGISADARFTGDAGDVVINALALIISDGARLTKSTFNDGDAGLLTINVGNLILSDGGRIRMDALGLFGRGATVTITATDSVSISGRRAIDGTPSGIFSDAVSLTDPGIVLIMAPNVSLSDQGRIQLVGFGDGDAGQVVLTVDTLTVTGGALLRVNNFGTGTGGSITINASEHVIVSGIGTNGRRSSISTETFFAGGGGELNITSPRLDVSESATVVADSFAGGKAGNITLQLGQLNLTAGGRVASSSVVQGDGGVITITADTVTIVGGLGADGRHSGILAQAQSAGTGGEIVLVVGILSISDGGFISSGSSGSGDGGNITVIASEGVFVSGLGPAGARSTISTETLFGGRGGDILIVAPLLRVDESSLVVADSFGIGRAGDITLNLGSLELRDGGQVSSASKDEGDAGTIDITADTVTISGLGEDGRSAGIFGSALSDGNAGEIILQVQALTISDGGFIASSTRVGSGQGGIVQIDATGTVSIFGLDADGNQSGVFSTVGADGMGGAIVITAGRLEVFNDGIVTTTTSGSGDGGSITIVTGEILLASGGSIAAEATDSGNAGNITMTAGGTVLLDSVGTGLFTESTSAAPDAGTAGDITVAAQEMQITNGAQISTESALADGGDIDLSLVTLLLVRDSAITTSVGTGTGAGGNIFIDPVFVILDSSVIQANAFGGPGGNITIITENFLASSDSLVEASSALGIAGTVAISAPETDLSSGVAVLTSTLMDAAARLAKQCGARGGRTLASFVGKGRGALPVQPGAAMMVHYLGDVTTKLGAAPENGVVTRIAMDAGQPRESRAFLVAGSLQLSCAE